MKKNMNTNKAFTLVELAISLIIIAILAASVITGTKMIENANFVRIAQEYKKTLNSINEFMTVYEYLPGDFGEASNTWGLNAVYDGDESGALNSAQEAVAAAQVLISSELLPDGFTLLPSHCTGTYSSVVMPYCINPPFAEHIVFRVFHNAGTYSRIFSSITIEELSGPMFTPREAYKFDKKFDDGKPTTGVVTSYDAVGSGQSNCVNDSSYNYSQTDNVNEYRISFDDGRCYVRIEIQRLLGIE